MRDYVSQFDWKSLGERSLRAKDFAAERLAITREIEAALIGDVSYRRAILLKHPGTPSLTIERSILAWFMGKDYNQEYHGSGQEWHVHFCRYMKLLIPSTTITPWMMEKAWALQQVLADPGRKVLNLIGSKNSEKSSFMCRASIALMSLDAREGFGFAAAPFKNAANYTVWSEFTRRFSEVQDQDTGMMPEMSLKNTDRIAVFSSQPGKFGQVELIGLDDTGKLQGAKSDDVDKGYFIVIADELALFPTTHFLDILENIKSQDNLIVFTGCNFKSVIGLEGEMCRPEGLSYEDLSIDEDQFWESEYYSCTIRSDGHRCPNILSGVDLYKFQLKNKDRETSEQQHSLDGAKYLEQVRSFPSMNAAHEMFLREDQIRSGGAHDEFVKSGPFVSVAFCDPAFGGGDDAKIGAFEFGPAKVQTMDGSYREVTVFAPIATPEDIPIKTKQVVTEEWIRRLRRVAPGKEVLLKPGRDVTVELQLAVYCAEFLQRHGISPSHFGFDDSMRGDFTHEMMTIIGNACRIIRFGSPPSDRQCSASGALANEIYKNKVSEMYAAFKEIVISGQLRRAGLIPGALWQMKHRKWIDKGTKEAIEPKDLFKKHNKGRSPDEADDVIGGLEVARLNGMALSFQRVSRSQAVGEQLSPAWKQMNKAHKPPRAARLRSRL